MSNDPAILGSDSDTLLTCIVAVHDLFRCPGVWSVHGDGKGLLRVQRKQAVVVLEEHDALPRAVEGEALVLVGAYVCLVEGGVPWDVVEVAEPHERHVQVGERVVDVGLAYLALRDGGHAVLAEVVPERPALLLDPALGAVEVHPGPERGGAGLGGGEVEPGGVVRHDADGVAVGHDVAVEVPLAADGPGQEPRVGAGGDAVHAVVGAHDAADVALADAHLEGPEEGLGHVALRDARVVREPRLVVPVVHVVRGVVLAAGGGLDGAGGRIAGVVAGDVLHAADEVHGVTAGHVGVLAGGLESAAPPRVAHHVDVGAPVRQPALAKVVHGTRLRRNSLHASSIH
jgi:hypothetical protein